MHAESKISTIYAKALLDLLEEQKLAEDKLKELDNQLSDFNKIINEDNLILHFFNSPIISWKEKYKVLELFFSKYFTSTLLSFIGILLKRGRISEISSISKSFHKLVCEVFGIRAVQIFSVSEINKLFSEKELNEINKQLKDYFKKEIIIESITQPDLLGGFLIRSEDVLIDLSLKKKLSNIKKELEMVVNNQITLGEKFYEN